ncbi:MAG: hypothetical protein U0573_08600 [Phycisphaerales bacterium]|nr:hypothetical protein [Planctomycetota bacterium]
MSTISNINGLRISPAPAKTAYGAASGSPGILGRATAVQDSVSLSRPEKLARSVDRLAAGSVSIPAIDKQPAQAPLPTEKTPATYTARGTISLYGQPADRNVAATGVALGRMVDISG